MATPTPKEFDDMITDMGDAIADVLEQLLLGEWRDTLNLPVARNPQMFALGKVLDKAVAFRAQYLTKP